MAREDYNIGEPIYPTWRVNGRQFFFRHYNQFSELLSEF